MSNKPVIYGFIFYPVTAIKFTARGLQRSPFSVANKYTYILYTCMHTYILFQRILIMIEQLVQLKSLHLSLSLCIHLPCLPRPFCLPRQVVSKTKSPWEHQYP